jgi:hypothetical protein
MTHTSKSISTLTGDVIIRDNDPDDSNLEDDEDLQDDKEPDGGVYGPQLYSGHRFSDHPPIHRIGKVEPPPGTSIAVRPAFSSQGLSSFREVKQDC